MIKYRLKIPERLPENLPSGRISELEKQNDIIVELFEELFRRVPENQMTALVERYPALSAYFIEDTQGAWQ